MTPFTRMRTRRGVSPILAVALMIAVVVAISLIVYAWASGATSKNTVNKSSEAEQVIAEQVTLDTTSLVVYLRNKSTFNVYVDSIYINNELMASSVYVELRGDAVTPVNLTEVISSHGGSCTFHGGDRVLLVTLQGTQIFFCVK